MYEQALFGAVRDVDPPCRVEINLQRLWPPDRLRWATCTPIWAQAQGVQVNTPVIGYLSAWVMSMAGDWLGLCRFTVRAGGLEIPLVHLVPAKALTKAEIR